MSVKKVFIVTHQQGFEADPVIDILNNAGIPLFRFNGDDGDVSSQISLFLNKNSYELSFSCDGQEINSSEIGVAWCQQFPPFLGQASTIGETLQRENLWELQRTAYLLLTGIPWLNFPQNTLAASCKPWQILQAMAVGLMVPQTVISNKPKDIRRFCANRVAIAKNLATPWVVESDGAVQAAYTQLVKSEWLEYDEELAFCPIIFQEFHQRRKDYRVTIIGKKIFTVCCDAKLGQEEDVRLNSTSGENYYPGELNQSIIEKLYLLMDRLSIQYCGADFMEDESGNIYFLEVNTCGAWWWVDCLYEGAVSQTIADYLITQLINK